MWEMWEFLIKCGQHFENVGNVGPLGTLIYTYLPTYLPPSLPTYLPPYIYTYLHA